MDGEEMSASEEPKGRTCPSIGRLTVHELASGNLRPCPLVISPDPDDPRKPVVDENAATPCCFDCDEFESCGNGDPKYSALPCVNDLCTLVTEPEHRRIVHCKMQYICQLMEALKKVSNSAGQFAMSVNEQMVNLQEELTKRYPRGPKVGPTHPALGKR